MRLLQVPTGSGEVIDLHPAVSVVTGLTAEQRQALIDVVAGLSAGEARGAGLVEAHDVLFDLDDDVLDLFELGGHPVDPVIGPGSHLDRDPDDQPGSGATAPEPTGDATTGSEAVDAARGEVDAARATLATAADALDAATAAREDAAAAVSACTAAVRDADGPDGARDEAAARGSATDLDAARQRLDAAEAAALAARDDASPAEEVGADGASELRSRRDDLDARRSELLGLLTVLDDDPADEVVELLTELDRADHAPAEHDPEALVLADEITALVAALDGLPALEPGSPSLDAARQRLDRARVALGEAEAARHDPPPDDAALAVERAHEELVAALDEAERRFRRGRARQRVEAARAAEQAALAELGHNSYTDFLTGRSRAPIRSDDAAGVDTARAELAAAEEAVARAEVATAAEQRRTEVRAQLAGALDRAAAIVGPVREEPLRVARALRTVVAQPPDRRDDLVGALTRAGVALTSAAGDDTDPPGATEEPRAEPEPEVELDLADLEVLARALVDEAQTNVVRRRTALAELAEVESELASLDGQLAASPTADAASSAVGVPASASRAVLDDDPEVRSAREAVRSAEAAAAAAAEQADARAAARDRLASAEAAELAATRGQAAARATLEAAEAALAAAEAQQADADPEALAASTTASTAPAEADGADQAIDGPASLGWYVLSRMAAQRAVSYVGGLPLVLDRTLDSLDPVAVREVLGRLEPTTSAVQLIVLTESEGALRWAEEVGPGRAAVVRPGPAAA